MLWLTDFSSCLVPHHVAAGSVWPVCACAHCLVCAALLGVLALRARLVRPGSPLDATAHITWDRSLPLPHRHVLCHNVPGPSAWRGVGSSEAAPMVPIGCLILVGSWVSGVVGVPLLRCGGRVEVSAAWWLS